MKASKYAKCLEAAGNRKSSNKVIVEPGTCGLCPICGKRIELRQGRTKNGRLIGSCGDAFTVDQWNS
jgi:hypothetical protein